MGVVAALIAAVPLSLSISLAVPAPVGARLRAFGLDQPTQLGVRTPGPLGVDVGVENDEAKSARAMRQTVVHKRHVANGPEPRKIFTHFLLRTRVRQTPDVDFPLLLQNRRTARGSRGRPRLISWHCSPHFALQSKKSKFQPDKRHSHFSPHHLTPSHNISHDLTHV